jgi:ribulose-5-phosphate 4-epimerase/fuculose-1-phosphate aldolase
MHDQIAKYTAKLVADRSAPDGSIAFAAQDDTLISAGNADLSRLAAQVLAQLNCLALAVACPALPFADFLVKRAQRDEHALLPRDTETRTFLHDIPFLRAHELGNDPAGAIADLLGNRKGIIVEGLGIVATGALTVEQAYINWSSVFHSTFVKYLEDLLAGGFRLPDEAAAFGRFRNEWLTELTCDGLEFRQGPFDNRSDILAEMARIGRYTVQRGLVDSFFGNISCRCGDLMYISQTASSLDELEGCIDPVPFGDSSTVGITASSELVAHRRIFEVTGCRAILHGHPRFAVVMSMACEEKGNCAITDCWKDCGKVRFLGDTPVVAGEIGAGGIAKNVPPVIGETGQAIVYGHGIFSIGKNDFAEAFRAMVAVENRCREEYFRRFDERYATTPKDR